MQAAPDNPAGPVPAQCAQHRTLWREPAPNSLHAAPFHCKACLPEGAPRARPFNSALTLYVWTPSAVGPRYLSVVNSYGVT